MLSNLLSRPPECSLCLSVSLSFSLSPLPERLAKPNCGHDYSSTPNPKPLHFVSDYQLDAHYRKLLEIAEFYK